jgi:hypothetical protein
MTSRTPMTSGMLRLMIAGTCLLFGTARSFGDKLDSAELARDSIDREMEHERLLIETKLYTQEAKQFRPDEKTLASVLTFLADNNSEARAVLLGLLEKDAQSLEVALAEANSRTQLQITASRASCTTVLADLISKRTQLRELRSSQSMSGQLASVLAPQNRWFWFCAVAAAAALVGLGLHDRRHEVRKIKYGGRGKAMGVTLGLLIALVTLLGITVSTFFFGDALYNAALSASGSGGKTPLELEADRIEARNEGIAQSQEPHIAAQAALAEQIAAWRETVGETLGEKGVVVDAYVASREHIYQLVVNVTLQERIVDLLDAYMNKRSETASDLRTAADDADSALRWRRWIRGGFGLMLVAMSAAGSFVLQRSRRRVQGENLATCPRCLGIDHWEAGDDAEFVAPEYDEPIENEEDDREIAVPAQPSADGSVRCAHTLPQSPPAECGYQLSAPQRAMKKLCFSALGIPASGKTHTLAIIHRELSVGNLQSMIHYDDERSSHADEWDRTVDDIIERRDTLATRPEYLPEPLAFAFRDRDQALGRTNVLTCLFDYAGELTISTQAADYRRRRALDVDGLLVFLDPTQPGGSQERALTKLCEDIREQHKIKSGRKVHIPIALCLSKIDLLPNQVFSGGAGRTAIEEFYRKLGEIDPEGEAMSQRVIADRSKVCTLLRPTIWPSWEIEGQVDSLVGNRFHYFPLSPVGLDSIGETDPNEQVIAPFGILEPLLWLLHMNGYPVLD